MKNKEMYLWIYPKLKKQKKQNKKTYKESNFFYTVYVT